MSTPTPICAPCERAMRCVQNDLPVKDKASEGFPATVWLGDVYGCPECDAQIVTGFGRGRPAIDCPSDARHALEFES